MASAGRDEFENQGVQWLGQDGGLPAEPYPDFVPGGLAVLKGQPADPGWALGAEKNEQRSDTVGGIDGVIMEQLAGLGPSVLRVHGARRAGPLDSGEIKACQLLVVGPANKNVLPCHGSLPSY